MPSIELSKLQAVTPARALSDTDRTAIQSSPARDSQRVASSASEAGVSIELASSIDSSSPPVDNDRVAEIRKALQDGSYPLVPTEIADAMIAARLSMGMPK